MDVAEIDRDLEARKHLWFGLKRLSGRARVAFVQMMAKSTNRDGIETRVTKHSGTTHEAYLDIMLLSCDLGLDLSKACEALERYCKKAS